MLQADVAPFGKDFEGGDEFVGKRLEVVPALHDFEFARFYLAEVHQLVDEREQVFRIAFYEVQLLDDLRVVAQLQCPFYGADDERDGSTELVGDVGEESYLVQCEFLYFACHFSQLCFLAGDFFVLLFQHQVLS